MEITRPKIAVAYDQDGWAFHRIAQRIQSMIPEWDTTIHRYPEIRRGELEGYDLGISMSYHPAPWLTEAGCKKLATCVYDHAYWKHGQKSDHRLKLAAASGEIYAANQLLASELREAGYTVSGLCEDGVDAEMFQPGPERSGEIVFGWAGNGGCRVKRLDELMWHCQQAGVKFEMADNCRQKRTLAEMPAYYHSIDVLVCTSTCEGTPNPVLEALACGKPVLTTPVGLTLEIEAGVIHCRSDLNDLQAKLKYMASMPREQLNELGMAGRQAIEKGWTWQSKIQQFRTML